MAGSATILFVIQMLNCDVDPTGSAIVVFGIVPASDQLELPTAAYWVDALPPSTITTLFNATTKVANQLLYASPPLSSDEEHQLLINVTKTQAPYTLTGFFVFPPASNSTSSQASPTCTSFITSLKTVSIVAGIMGSLIFLFVVGVVFFLIFRWRMQARRELSENLPSESSKPGESTFSHS